MPTEMTIALKKRTRQFAVNTLRMLVELPSSQATHIISGQLTRSSGSVGCNYRSSQRARSVADLVAKLKIVEEELDESMYWMEILVEAGIVPKETLKPLYLEADELLSIIVASIKSLRSKGGKVAEDVGQYGSNSDSPFLS